jgi:hypothetical protein
MAHAIRVDSRFATAHDTARILGVSKSRTEALIKIARRYTDRILKRQTSEAGQSVDKGHSKRKSATTVGRKSSGRDAGSKISATKSATQSKRAKAKR